MRGESGATLSTVRTTVFGLDVHSREPLSFLAGARAEPCARRLDLCRRSVRPADLDWPPDAEPISREAEPGGRELFRIEHSARAGYLFAGDAYGAFLLSPDALRVRCAVGGVAAGAWQRLLVAQVLPFAATLRGLEAFHASAVVHRGQGIGFAGPSGSGKTSLALEFCRRGAGFLTDDVLALECRGREVFGHPGTPVAGVAHAEVSRGFVSHASTLAVNARERLVGVRPCAAPAPLGALFFLARRSDGPEVVRFERVERAGALLAATFNFVLAGEQRLARLLEVCALVAQRRVQRVVFGPSVDAGRLAAAIVRQLETPQ